MKVTFKDKIDITMTATLRPAIFRETLDGIFRCIIGKKDRDRFNLILNIDAVGEDISPKRMVKIAKKYFPNVVYNISKKPSFAKAVIWVWKNSSADYIFHIEDDWKFLKKINVDNMINILNKNKNLSSLRLYKLNTPNKKVMRTFMCRWVYQEKYGFYLAKDWKKQFGLNPILIKRVFIDEALKRMVNTINPEKQFRSSQEHMRDFIKSWTYGLYTSPGQQKTIDDAGRIWARKNRFKKPKRGPFLTWEKH